MTYSEFNLLTSLLKTKLDETMGEWEVSVEWTKNIIFPKKKDDNA